MSCSEYYRIAAVIEVWRSFIVIILLFVACPAFSSRSEGPKGTAVSAASLNGRQE
jgi:hypothetical protein